MDNLLKSFKKYDLLSHWHTLASGLRYIKVLNNKGGKEMSIFTKEEKEKIQRAFIIAYWIEIEEYDDIMEKFKEWIEEKELENDSTL